jgi:riboflavin biosynthesis pyrimidine reductase
MERLERWFDEAEGERLPLGPELDALYGPLRMARHPGRPHVYTNFAASVDGVVVVDPPRGNGAEISGGAPADRAVMGLLRAVADAVVIGAGTLRAEPRHLWTAEHVGPGLAGPFRALRAALGLAPEPLQIVVTASGDVDPSWPVFSGAAPSLVVTAAAGAARLRASGHPLRVAVPDAAATGVTLREALAAAGVGEGSRVLVESGPTLVAQFLAQGAIDDLFLTVAPWIVGRAPAVVALGLAEGTLFGPGRLGARLASARRAGDLLLLRYAIAASGTTLKS